MSQSSGSSRGHAEITVSDLYGPWCPTCCVKCAERGQVLPWKTKYVIASIVVAFNVLLVALLFRYVGYADTQVVMSPGDMRLMTDNVDTSFCAAQTLTSASGNTFQAFVFPDSPPLNTQPLNFSLQYTLEIPPRDYVYWSYHLVPGSNQPNANLHTCVTALEADLYIIDGKDAFDHWKSDVNCDWCTVEHRRYSSCDPSTPYETWPSLASSAVSGDIYIAYYNPQLPPLYVSLSTRLDIETQSYDISGVPKESCSESTCSLDLSYESKDVVLVAVPSHGTYNNVISETIISRCVPRISRYIVFFMCVPMAIWVMLTALGLCLKKINDNIVRTTENADNARVFSRIANEDTSERARLVGERDLSLPPRVVLALERLQRSNGRSPSSHVTPPPSYQDVVGQPIPEMGRGESTGPPSYEECMSN
ncbi:Hypp4235 [Branchiostoma lanceolatum]|uniref:Hypp4235 protein n=1 Tax=Branchiostoma lanceolatum TaxID=7740 RepID=A0A8K0ABD9_BRALA|nr:Hypp4235 [Branchiostoma lanceolatum]